MAFEAFDFPSSARPADWARMYRDQLGWNPVPAFTPQEGAVYKRPISSWKEFETTPVPQATFERWYGPDGQYANRFNMGTITGASAGRLVVIDLDVKEGANGLWWFSALIAAENSNMAPETPHQRTGGGGQQWFFIWPDGAPMPTFKTPIGVDVRGQGGFVMLPPSLHPERGELHLGGRLRTLDSANPAGPAMAGRGRRKAAPGIWRDNRPAHRTHAGRRGLQRLRLAGRWARRADARYRLGGGRRSAPRVLRPARSGPRRRRARTGLGALPLGSEDAYQWRDQRGRVGA